METKLYKVNRLFAQRSGLPVYFAGQILRETARANYMFGRGTTETAKMGKCCNCGRTLTHPVSVKLGIGPECGQHYWDWDRVGGYTEENIAALSEKIKRDIQVDSWIPKTCVEEIADAEEEVIMPRQHPIYDRENQPVVNLKVAILSKGRVKIVFPFDHEDIARIKTLTGRKWHPQSKHWSCPFSKSAIEQLRGWGFKISAQLENFVPVTAHRIAEITIPGLKGDLFGYQKQGVAFLEYRKGRALIGDEMGLGKTMQAIGYLQLHTEKRPAIVVCPSSAKLNWERELDVWMPDPKVQGISGKSTNVKLTGEIIVLTYDILTAWVSKLKALKPKVLITDECHYYKNRKALRTKAVKQLALGIPHVIALSGTPILNRPIEAYNALAMIDPTNTPTFWQFAQKFCDAKHNRFGWDLNGASNTEELNKHLTSTVMIRRLKKDVLKDLPPKMRSVVPLEIDNRGTYRVVLREFRKQKEAGSLSGADILAQIESLKQLAVQGKMVQAINWIKDYLEIQDSKLVVFATHKFVIDALMKEFGNVAVKIDGSVPTAKRLAVVDRFQSDDSVHLFIGNIKAAGVAITLTAASSVVFLELGWTPGEHDQAEDRIHRIGQNAESINAYYLIALDTIEDKIVKLLDKKRKVLDSVLDGKKTEDASMLSQLLKELEADNEEM